jgi:prepilin-type N-terminal cleavage/methylation domain-containing protein
MYPSTHNPSSGTSAHSRAGVSLRRGMTLLEVVFSLVLLSIIGASAASLFGFVSSMQLREQRRLAATEVAHRLILAYLDDPTEMPNPSLPVEYGPQDAPARFRWEYTEERVQLNEIAGDRRDTSRQSPLSADRFRQITVRVWLSEESGGSRYPTGDTPQAVLSRMMDPITIRNPDSAMNMLSSERGRERWMQELMGFTGNVPTPSGFTGRGGAGGQTGTSPGPRTRRDVQRPSVSAGDAFRRGNNRQGSGRVPAGQVGMNMSRMGGSFDAADFNSGQTRTGGRR